MSEDVHEALSILGMLLTQEHQARTGCPDPKPNEGLTAIEARCKTCASIAVLASILGQYTPAIEEGAKA